MLQKPDMTGRICLITGATSGIGEATGRALAGLGANLIVHGRDGERCQRVVADFRNTSGNRNIEPAVADLASLEEVRSLAAELHEQTDHLDVLINNAGAMFPTYRETVDGFEQTFAVNHLAPFLLTNLLLDLFQAVAPARIINVASGAHRRATLAFADLNSRRNYEPRGVYAKSKLMNILFTHELARRLAGSGVTVNALSPGIVHTEFGVKDGMGPEQQAVMDRGMPPEAGARTSVYLASSPEVADVSGTYFQDCAPFELGANATDHGAARRLWDVSTELVGLPRDVDQASR